MISSGRFLYHLQDIAEIEAMPKPLNPIHQMNLRQMKAEVAEFEKHNPAEAKEMRDRAKELAA